MKKKILLFAISIGLIAGLVYVFNQSETKTATEILREKHSNFLKNHPYNQSKLLSKKERKSQGLPPNAYFEQEYLNEMDPNTGRTNRVELVELQYQLNKNRTQKRSPGDASDNAWVERGPNNVGGRTRTILFDPNDATQKRVFAGGVSGGLWVNNDITDANSSWQQVGVSENLAVSAITVDPNNTQIMYLSTGESQANPSAAGNGVWKSTDGGASWVNVFKDSFNPNLEKRLFYVNDIKAWNNNGNTEIFIGVAGASVGYGDFPGAEVHGLYKSTDGGATWNRVATPDIPGRTPGTVGALYEPNDIEIASDNSILISTESSIYGSGGGTILKSTNGISFTVVHTVPNGLRTEIAISKTNPALVYILAQLSTEPIGIYKTTDSFATITPLPLPNDADTGIPDNDFTRGQAFYDLVIEVDPTNDNIVYVGGINLFKSITGGNAWGQITKWSNNNKLADLKVSLVHADQHGLAFSSSSRMIFGNDGGVYFSDNSGTNILPRKLGYNTVQFYTIGVAPTSILIGDNFLAGAQDNGTQFFENSNTGIDGTVDVSGGDGAASFFDQDGTDKYFITNYVYNNSIKLYDFTTSQYRTINQEDTSNGDFINQQDLDSNLDILYSNYSSGNNFAIKRYSNIKSDTVTSRDLTNDLMDAEPSYLKISPYTKDASNLFIGLKNGKVLFVSNAEFFFNTWSEITGANFVGSISDIEFGASENEIFVTMHNYGVKNIWYTNDKGVTWQEKEGNLPDIPVKAILQNPLNKKEVIIGTELGIWRTSDFSVASPVWVQSYNGMSNVKVTDLDLRDDNMVFAATYGRGIFSGQFTAATASVDEVLAGKKVFSIYPTISNGNFTVFAKNSLGKTKINIFNINGKEVYKKEIDFNKNEKQEISVNLKAGVYIVNLVDENNKKSSSKIIIE